MPSRLSFGLFGAKERGNGGFVSLELQVMPRADAKVNGHEALHRRDTDQHVDVDAVKEKHARRRGRGSLVCPVPAV